MIHARLSLTIVAILTLAGCEPKAEGTDDPAPAASASPTVPAAPIESDPTLKSFASTTSATASDLLKGLEGMPGRWKSDAAPLSSDDSFSGGWSTTYLGKSGSIAAYYLADGQPWRVRFNIGVADKCNDGSDDADLVRRGAAMLKVELSQANAQAVAKALAASSGTETVNAKGARLTAATGCVDTLTFTAQ